MINARLNKNGNSWTLIYPFDDSQETVNQPIHDITPTHAAGGNKHVLDDHHAPVVVAGQYYTALYSVRWNWGLIREKMAPAVCPIILLEEKKIPAVAVWRY